MREEALARAEEECLDDADVRSRRQQLTRCAAQSATPHMSRRSPERSANATRTAPTDAATEIAAHACQAHSKRIGRTAQAKDFDPAAIDLAVQAHIRHRYTNYDELMAAGADRVDARALVRTGIDEVLARWRGDA